MLTRIVVDKSTHHAKPHSICYVDMSYLQYNVILRACELNSCRVREYNKHLMTGPEGNSEFCFPRNSMFGHILGEHSWGTVNFVLPQLRLGNGMPMLVPIQMGTNMAAGNQQKHLSLSFVTKA